MNTFYEDFFDRLEDLHQDVIHAIEGLPPEALDWTLGETAPGEMNTLNILVTHLSGAERFWIGDVASGEASGRVRAKEFEVSGMAAGDLIAEVHHATAYARSVLDSLCLEDLTAARNSPRDGLKFTLGWALLHALEHTALHLGHIQITRQCWDEHANSS